MAEQLRCLICENEQDQCETCRDAERSKLVRPGLADDLRYIAAHESDPRKEDIIYEAAEALEASGHAEFLRAIRQIDALSHMETRQKILAITQPILSRFTPAAQSSVTQDESSDPQTLSQKCIQNSDKPQTIDPALEAPASITSKHSTKCLEADERDPDCPRCADLRTFRENCSSGVKNDSACSEDMIEAANERIQTIFTENGHSADASEQKQAGARQGSNLRNPLRVSRYPPEGPRRRSWLGA